MTHHLILGAGPAAINAIETIREFDGGASQITLVCDEPAYSRMVLPYYLANQIPQQHVFTGDDAYFTKLKVTRRIGPKATRVDPQRKVVTLADGSTLAFDNLLIATGSSPATPPIPGVDLPGVFPLWTLAQTEAVLQAAAPLTLPSPQGGEGRMPEVVFIGAGFIGLIVLNAMHKRGWKLSLVEMGQHVLPRMLEADCAVLVDDWLRKKRVTLHVGTTVAKIEPAASRAASAPGAAAGAAAGGVAQRKQVTLANGQTVEADLVIVATGIRPNLDFPAGSGVETAQGIMVNDRMQTNFPFIYAAGDVAQGPDLLGGPSETHPIQPTAVEHGRIAGANMAGQNIHYPGSLLMNILDVCGLQCASFGRWAEDSDAMHINNADRPIYRKLAWTGDQITGAIFVGPANDVGMLTDVGMVKGIMQTRTHLGDWKNFLREHPFDIRRPYIACEVARQLVGQTLLGKPTQARQYRFQGAQPGPQVTRPGDHAVFVDNKGF